MTRPPLELLELWAAWRAECDEVRRLHAENADSSEVQARMSAAYRALFAVPAEEIRAASAALRAQAEAFCVVTVAGDDTRVREWSGHFTNDDHYFMAEAAEFRPELPDGLYCVPVRWTSEPTGGEADVPVLDWDRASLAQADAGGEG